MDEVLHNLLAKYAHIAPGAVERVYRGELGKYKSPKDVDKAARRALHQMTGAFMTRHQLKAGQAFMLAYAGGDRAALAEALKLHASTRERLHGIEGFYGRLFECTGVVRRVLDLACGLNPLYIGDRGYSVVGADAHGEMAGFVNEWAAMCGWDVEVACADLLSEATFPECDLALLLKLLPVLERQEKGSGMRLLQHTPGRFKAVSFPIRTLGGRGVGMERNYSEWFEKNLPDGLCIAQRFLEADELCYIVLGGLR